jgi:hypothetical protein
MSSEDVQRKYAVLVQIKLDATRLFDRISKRRSEYVSIFAVKRTRDHFKQIFANRYSSVGISELKDCSDKTISAIDAFYNKVDDLWWYLQHTEDMPGTVEDRLIREIKNIGRFYDELLLYLDQELKGNDDESEIPPLEGIIKES